MPPSRRDWLKWSSFGVALMKELDKIPHVSYRPGSNEPASISLNGGFPIK